MACSPSHPNYIADGIQCSILLARSHDKTCIYVYNT
jgi:hypothetical protein